MPHGPPCNELATIACLYKGPERKIYLINVGTQEISNWRLVNGAATEASASDNEIPTSAAFKAPQSFAPSPQKPQQ